MAKRKHKRFTKVLSDAVQGEGSWVKFRTPVFADFDDFSGMGANPDDAEASKNEHANKMKFGFGMLKKLVIDWNWVDDDDKPLPSPKEQPDIIDALPLQELVFLVESLDLKGLTAGKKN